MNFYKHYIGDFQRDTGHLSLTERGAYLCLMHHYYATEKPLPNDHTALCRIAGAQEKAERDAVRTVMAFFTPVDSGLMHKRIEAEIEKAGKQADTNRQIALEREARRKAQRQDHEASTNRATNREPNQTPDTRHQKTEDRKTARKRAAPAVLLSVSDMVADGVEEQHAEDWLRNRRSKDLAGLTRTIWQQTKEEARKAGIPVGDAIRIAAGEGWGGFKAAWLLAPRQATTRQGAHGPPSETAYARQMREKWEKVAPEIAAKRPATAEVIELEPRNVVTPALG